jgi:hypothetical protein
VFTRYEMLTQEELGEHGWLQANSGVSMPRLKLLDKTFSS